MGSHRDVWLAFVLVACGGGATGGASGGGPSAAPIHLDGWRVDGVGSGLRLGAAGNAPVELRTTIAGADPISGYERIHGALVQRFEVRGVEVTERVEAIDGSSVEQSWSFDARPTGADSIEVRLDTGGVGVRPDGAGAVVGERAGAYRVSSAVWIDATGRRTPVPLTIDHGLRWELDRDLLERSEYPAVLDPVLSPVFDVSPATADVAFGDQQKPRAAFDGVRHAVVWSDGGGIWFNTIDATTGALGSSTGVQLVPGTLSGPDIVWLGDRHLVTYIADDGVWGVTVDADGAVLEGPFAIATELTAAVSTQRVAFDGGGFLLVYSRRALPTHDVVAVRLGLDARPLAAPVVLADDTLNHVLPAVAAVPGHYLVAWTATNFSTYEDRALRIRSDGTWEDAAPWTLSPSSIGSGPSLAQVGGVFFAVWTTRTVGSVLVARRLASDGTWIDALPLNLSPTSRNAVSTSVACGGARCWVGHVNQANSFDTFAVGQEVLAPTGGALSTGGRAEWPTATNASVASAATPSAGLIAWDTLGTLDANLIGARLGSSGALDAPALVIAGGAAQQSRPEAAWNGSRFLVAWSERTWGTGVAPTDRRLATWVDRDGTPAAVPFSAPFPGTSTSGMFGHGGDVYFLGTRPTAPGFVELLAQRVAPDGSLRGAPFVLPTTPTGTGGVGLSVGADFAVSWGDAWRRYATDGTPVVGGTLPMRFGARAVGLGPDGLVFGADRYSFGSGLFVVRQRLDGTAIDTTPIVVSSDPRDVYASVASDGENLMAIWTRRVGTYELRAARIARSGDVLDSLIVDDGLTNDQPVMLFDGVNYLVAYVRGGGVSLATVSPVGVVVQIDRVAPTSTAPVLATTGDGTSLLAWQEAVAETPYRNYRIRALLVTSESFVGATCSTDADCGGGPCVDGVCCASSCGGGRTDDCEACSVAAGAMVDGRCDLVAAGRTCRAAAGVCDVVDVCDGTSSVCGDARLASGAACRPAAGPCDVEESCDGASVDCPIDGVVADGTGCGGLVCGDARCAGGVCVSGMLACDDGDACTSDGCVEPTGCQSTPIAGCCVADLSCDDGDPCTADHCSDMVCTHDAVCPDVPVWDAGTDAGADAGRDAGLDAFVAGDAGIDAGPMPAPAGCTCTAARRDVSAVPLVGVWLACLAHRARRRRSSDPAPRG